MKNLKNGPIWIVWTSVVCNTYHSCHFLFSFIINFNFEIRFIQCRYMTFEQSWPLGNQDKIFCYDISHEEPSYFRLSDHFCTLCMEQNMLPISKAKSCSSWDFIFPSPTSRWLGHDNPLGLRIFCPRMLVQQAGNMQEATLCYIEQSLIHIRKTLCSKQCNDPQLSIFQYQHFDVYRPVYLNV